MRYAVWRVRAALCPLALCSMSATNVASELASAVASYDSPRIHLILNRLRGDSALALDVLGVLIHHTDLEVRTSAVGWAHELLGARAEPLLETSLDDPDPATRNQAMLLLTSLNPRWPRQLVKRYSQMLDSDNFPDVHQAIWQLTRFRATSALPRIRTIAQTDSWSATRLNARAAVLVMEGQEEELVAALMRHEHDVARVWIKGLLYLGTDRAITTLETFGRDAPDEQCRQLALDALEKLDQVRPLFAN